MGNALALCFYENLKSSSVVKLVFWEGNTTTLKGKRIAGEIMFQYPDKMVCHANSFYIGQTIPALSISDELISGETYFVLPIDRFAFKVLSISSLSTLASSSSSSSGSINTSPKPINFGECPFQYVKGIDGRMSIKVLPEFLLKLIITKSAGSNGSSNSGSNNNLFLCSTPELRKHYDVLVGSSKEKVWSPKLETITECNNKTRFSPCRLLGLERRSTDHRFIIKSN
ncbi:Protein of unknown function DUF4228 [Macleaya cordata]|uniref:DUF4228 domain protein n=1 Tax=Macleaya cordata TaxID=56857 RepID=A0A200R735_MACCD|nr:Protein of unknown function DUF4228 [Macleaya cordata]